MKCNIFIKVRTLFADIFVLRYYTSYDKTEFLFSPTTNKCKSRLLSFGFLFIFRVLLPQNETRNAFCVWSEHFSMRGFSMVVHTKTHIYIVSLRKQKLLQFCACLLLWILWLNRPACTTLNPRGPEYQALGPKPSQWSVDSESHWLHHGSPPLPELGVTPRKGRGSVGAENARAVRWSSTTNPPLPSNSV